MMDADTMEVFNYARKAFGGGKVYLSQDMKLSMIKTPCLLGSIVDFDAKHMPEDFSTVVNLKLSIGVWIKLRTHMANIMREDEKYDIVSYGAKCTHKLPNFEVGVEYLVLGRGEKNVLVYDMENNLSLQPALAFKGMALKKETESEYLYASG